MPILIPSAWSDTRPGIPFVWSCSVCQATFDRGPLRGKALSSEQIDEINSQFEIHWNKDPTGPPIWINALFRHYRKSASQFVIRFPASQSFISNPSACEAVQFRTPPTFLLSGGHSAFPDQRMALFWARF
jgi:hypothetical protein